MVGSRTREFDGPRKTFLGLFCIITLCLGLAFTLTSCGARHTTNAAQHEARVLSKSPESASSDERSHGAGSTARVERQSDAENPEKPRNPKGESDTGVESSSPGTTSSQDSVTGTAQETQPEVTPEALPHETPIRRPAALGLEIARVSGAGNKIALTFDAGASAAPAPAVLQALRNAGLHATFFLTGKWCEANPEIVRQIAAEGHEIANHTYSHPDLRKLSDTEIVQQLQKTNDIVERITGRGTAPYFRPPYGGRDRRVIRVAAAAGYTSIYWSLDCWDAFKKGITSEEITRRVLTRLDGGDIVLMHCGSPATARALPGLISEIKKRGYDIVEISELIAN